QSLTVKIGDQERALTADDVANLIKEHETVKGEHGKLSKVVDVLKKYETDPETYVTQTEAALAVVSKLIETGVIDNKGNLVKKESLKGSEDGESNSNLWNKGGKGASGEGDTSGSVGEDRVARIVAKALESVTSRLKGIEETQGSLLQSTLEQRVRVAHPEFDAEDVERVFETAYRDGKKKLMDHAKDYAGRKAEKMKGIKAEVAQELGIDLAEYERRIEAKKKMKALGDEHGLLTMAEGKKLTFKPEKADKTAMSPRDATINFFKNMGVA
ncbi:MAG: hypothetical protein V1857_02770, partial [archaeon]